MESGAGHAADPPGGPALTREAMVRAVCELLAVPPSEVDRPGSLADLGMDSVRMMHLAGWLREHRVEVTFRELAEDPSLDAWWRLVAERTGPAMPGDRTDGRRPAVDASAPFALTPVQHAYWVGREDGQVLGGVGCHAYFEFDGAAVDPHRLEPAVRRVIERHGMLRTVFAADGSQRIADASSWPGLTVHDLRDLSAPESARKLESVRALLAGRRLEVARGEVFDVQLSLLPGDVTRVHVDIDLLVADVTSIRLVFEDLVRAYRDPGRPLPRTDYGFPHYLQGLDAVRTRGLDRARDYWRERLAVMPGAPRLPLAVAPERIGRPEFVRRTHRLAASGRTGLLAHCRRHGLTVAMALATAYAEIIGAWSTDRRFLLNVPLFDRQPVHPDVSGLVADFTSVLLLDVDVSGERPFHDRARSVQERFRDDATHADYSGIEVLRDLARTRPDEPPTAPVVFACNLGQELVGRDFCRDLGALTWMLSQTPQVWLDHQVYEMDGGLLLAWDAVEELFPVGVLDAMFGAYVRLVERLATTDCAWLEPAVVAPPAAQLAVRARANSTDAPEKSRILHDRFFQHAAERPERIALYWGVDGALSYGELAQRSLAVAADLTGRGLDRGEPVAVCLPRGRQQITAVLGVLAAGGCYVPMDPEQPATRRDRMLRRAGIRLVLTSGPVDVPNDGRSGAEAIVIPVASASDALPAPVDNDPGSPAYVFFTSGSTGEPKGVEVTHRSAANTVEDVNTRFDVGPADRALAVSAPSFDLSVYDIFGPLSVGGALVLTEADQHRDPYAWLDLMRRHRVTLWNSVPALMEMLLEAQDGELPASLRLALLSGDWIGTQLPGRLAAQSRKRCRLIALGGATEAAIWSNALEVTEIPPHWTSVPYGFPLRNQAYRVVDERGRDRPDWVSGELWIGGVGVATGYRGDPEQTRLRFVERDDRRWFRTGDLGRYWPDGTLEFLGRADRQVKIRGQRIELGEIEAALRAHPLVGQAVATVVDERSGRLLAAVTPKDGGAGRTAVARTVRSTASGSEAASVRPARRADGTDEADAVNAAGLQHRLVEALLCRLLPPVAAGEVPAPAAVLADACGACHGQRPALRLWWDYLAGRGVLTEEAGGYLRGPRTDEVTDPHRWPTVVDQCRGTDLEAVAVRLDERVDDLAAIIRGEMPSAVLLDDPVLAPEALAGLLPGAAAAAAWIGRRVTELSVVPREDRTDRPLRIAEIRARSGCTARALAGLLDPARVTYTLLDPSAALLETARLRLAGLPHRFDFRRALDGWVPAGSEARFDVVVVHHALHVHTDAAAGVAAAALLLTPGGVLLGVEAAEQPPLALVSAALLAGGTLRTASAGPENGDGYRTAMPTPGQWRRLLLDGGLRGPRVRTSTGGLLYLTARRAEEVTVPRGASVRRWVTGRLPAAMVPERVVVLPRLPMTAHGKIDRSAVRDGAAVAADKTGGAGGAASAQRPRGAIERTVAALWHDLLGIDRVGRHDSFFALGGDSLTATRMVNRLRAEGVRGADLPRLFKTPVLKDFAASLTLGGSAVPTPIAGDPANRYQPFALTEIQSAYLVGRRDDIALGGTGARWYSEFEGAAPDLARIGEVWDRLVRRHEMLRVTFDEEGRQQIRRRIPPTAIPVVDAGEAPQAALDAMRERLCREDRDPARHPPFALAAVRYRTSGQQRVRLGIALENAALDGLSMMIVLTELDRLCQDPTAGLPPIGVSFRDYVLQAAPDPTAVEAARQYWRERLATLPPAPSLPTATDPSALIRPRFARREGRLDAVRWRALTERARAHGVTPSAVLLTCYAQVLGAWSAQPELTVNLTLFDRREVHPDIHRVVGDFTSLLLVAYRPVPGGSFLDAVRGLQERQWQDLQHREVTAVWVLRELARAQGAARAAMPVVFTSALGAPEGLSLGLPRSGLTRVRGLSQTPQVWLDNQVYEMDGELHFDWDAVEELFPDGLLDDMFAAYAQLLTWLTESDWHDPPPDLLPAGQRAVRDRVNAVSAPVSDVPLHAGFFTRAESEPERTACLWRDGSLTYGALADRALRVAAALLRRGVRAGDTVGVTLPKGPDQIAAVLGVLSAGAAYVPVGIDQPTARRERMYARAGVRTVLAEAAVSPSDPTGPGVLTMADALREAPLPSAVLVGGDALAYVVFTSGSTGEPKGVEVVHGAAVNTVLEVCGRFGVGVGDRVLGVSALDFDLSVFDVFGVLGVGGVLVLPGEGERRDACAWVDLVRVYGVTVWNSVPALLEMLLVAGEGGGGLGSLRLVLVSGDWVGLDLPGRLVRVVAGCRLVVLGGATEAAVWSNAFEVVGGVVPRGWGSVPYGWPLRGQCFRVVDVWGRDCPDWVAGELWIGGVGVAVGYRGDVELTARKFPRFAGGRWYRTGDVGRYRPGGILEFLGRVDGQVKIRGHRLELGEVEAVCQAHPGVGRAVVVCEGDRSRLAAFVVPVGGVRGVEDLSAFLAARLPAHAVPATVTVLDDLPLTPNGKINRPALQRLSAAAPAFGHRPPRGRTETELATLWRQLLRCDEVARDVSFFALGGDSLLATRLIHEVRRRFGADIRLRELLDAPTVAGLAAAVARHRRADGTPDIEDMEDGSL
ncbi:non-ribosomal peptide synthetase [Streptomyces celluloflavus]|uniref:non-ribosomal peptide synthetase n=1 Tax=Streptomyces celluloflavus TaxID=58344 RepID=UPI0036C1BCAE